MEILNQRAPDGAGRWPGTVSRRTFLLVALLLCAGNLPGQTVSREYRIKAAFLYNFASFVTWPSDAFAERNSPLVIGVLGNDPFREALDEIVRNEKVGEHPIVVKRFNRIEDVKECHILFIGRSEASQMDECLTAVKDRPILTVSDTENFTDKSGMIQFTTEKEKIRLRINADAAQKVNLSISSRLLRLADIVRSKPE